MIQLNHIKIPDGMNQQAVYESIARLATDRNVEKVFIPVLKNSLLENEAKAHKERDSIELHRLMEAGNVLCEVIAFIEQSYDIAHELRRPKPEQGIV